MKKFRPFTARFFGAAIALTALIGSLLVLPAPMGAWASSSGTTTDEEVCRHTTSHGVDVRPKFSGGDGSEDNPFLISSPGNLKTLSNCSMEWKIIAKSTQTLANSRYDAMSPTHNASNVFYRQTTNIDMTGENILVLFPTSTRRFKANYDGGGFAIHGLSPTLTASPTGAAGLFGWGENCSVTNLTVSGSLTREAGPADLGLVMGYSSGCTFDNVTAHGTVASSGTGSPDVGGIIGHALNSTIENSVSHVDVVAAGSHVGGAVGYLDVDSSMTDVDVRPGQVSVSPVERGSVKNTSCTSFYGGAIGFAYGSDVLRVSSSVRVEADLPSCTSSSVVRGGGLIGQARLLSEKGSIENSSSTGDLVVKNGNRFRFLGGLVGYSEMPITSSFSTSHITINEANDSGSPSDYLGGLVGEAVGPIHQSYFAGSIDITALNTADTDRNARTGGLVGRLRAAVTESYANVVITGNAARPAALVGDVASVTDASVTDSFAFGSVEGAYIPSGLIGRNHQSDASTVDISYTFVELNRGSSNQVWRPVSDAGDVSSSVFWNLERSGIPAGAVESAVSTGDNFLARGSTPLTDDKLTSESSFTGFDFSSTWTMGSCGPYLTWIGSSPAGLCAPQAPTAPTITTITPGDGQLTVAFTAPLSDGGDPITEYQYLIDGVFETDYVVTSSPFVVSGLTNGTTYTVTLKAINDVDSSPSSTGVTGTPVAPEADPAPASAPAPKPGSTPTVEPSVSPTPTPTPPAPTPPAPTPPAPTPPAPTPPAPTPPVSEPETAVLAAPPSGSPPPSNPPATPSSPPAATPAGPGVATLTSEELMSGSIALNRGTQAVIMPSVLLHDIAVSLLPPGAPLDEGALKIETGQTVLVVIMVSLGDVTLTASEMGEFIQFTLIAPGFEPNSMTITVTKQTLAALFWVQVGLIAAAVAVGLGLLWWFLGRRNRKQVRVASAPRPGFA